jgi:general secretion pathway protein G
MRMLDSKFFILNSGSFFNPWIKKKSFHLKPPDEKVGKGPKGATKRGATFLSPLTEKGFTFIELMLVLAILALLAGIAAAVSMGKIRSSKEAALKTDLANFRKALDDYYADTGKYPKKLDDLVEKRYLRAVPQDPFTESSDTWQAVYSDKPDQKDGIVDVHSGSDEKSGDGGNYSEW